jgi:hypothetical protein
VFPNTAGKRIDINNFRHRGWTSALSAAGIAHRRIYDLRHTYATWSLAAGIDIFTLARRMGTSVAMIDRTYGHLAAAPTTTSAICWTPTTPAPQPLGAVWALDLKGLGAKVLNYQGWAVPGSNRRPPACKAGALTKLS